jgi:hypothetical protein
MDKFTKRKWKRFKGFIGRLHERRAYRKRHSETALLRVRPAVKGNGKRRDRDLSSYYCINCDMFAAYDDNMCIKCKTQINNTRNYDRHS